MNLLSYFIPRSRLCTVNTPLKKAMGFTIISTTGPRLSSSATASSIIGSVDSLASSFSVGERIP